MAARAAASEGPLSMRAGCSLAVSPYCTLTAPKLPASPLGAPEPAGEVYLPWVETLRSKGFSSKVPMCA